MELDIYQTEENDFFSSLFIGQDSKDCESYFSIENKNFRNLPSYYQSNFMDTLKTSFHDDPELIKYQSCADIFQHFYQLLFLDEKNTIVINHFKIILPILPKIPKPLIYISLIHIRRYFDNYPWKFFNIFDFIFKDLTKIYRNKDEIFVDVGDKILFCIFSFSLPHFISGQIYGNNSNEKLTFTVPFRKHIIYFIKNNNLQKATVAFFLSLCNNKRLYQMLFTQSYFLRIFELTDPKIIDQNLYHKVILLGIKRFHDLIPLFYYKFQKNCILTDKDLHYFLKAQLIFTEFGFMNISETSIDFIIRKYETFTYKTKCFILPIILYYNSIPLNYFIIYHTEITKMIIDFIDIKKETKNNILSDFTTTEILNMIIRFSYHPFKYLKDIKISHLTNFIYYLLKNFFSTKPKHISTTINNVSNILQILFCLVQLNNDIFIFFEKLPNSTKIIKNNEGLFLNLDQDFFINQFQIYGIESFIIDTISESDKCTDNFTTFIQRPSKRYKTEIDLICYLTYEFYIILILNMCALFESN